MNRCEVCDKTDEDNPRAGIALFDNEARCNECHTVISQCTEDYNDTHETDWLDDYLLDEALTEQDDHWIEAPLPEVPEQ